VIYLQVSDYIMAVRTSLQDLVSPYRYPDDQIVTALNACMFEMSRMRADIFMDLKYQRPLNKGDLSFPIPPVFSASRVSDYVPVPSNYAVPVEWYMEGFIQFSDVTDVSDQRAQAYVQKFQQMMLGVAA